MSAPQFPGRGVNPACQEERVLRNLNTDPAAFDPEEVRILAAAFDKAWEAIQASGAQFATDAAAEAARVAIAKHIIEAAKRGERNERRLCDGALVAITPANLRTVPRHADSAA
jgi:hypothetical protein